MVFVFHPYGVVVSYICLQCLIVSEFLIRFPMVFEFLRGCCLAVKFCLGCLMVFELHPCCLMVVHFCLYWFSRALRCGFGFVWGHLQEAQTRPLRQLGDPFAGSSGPAWIKGAGTCLRLPSCCLASQGGPIIRSALPLLASAAVCPSDAEEARPRADLRHA